jgi:ketosteroid isomerase-like protein
MPDARREDHRQITELCSRLAAATDARDFRAIAACFTADGTLETVIPPNVMHGRAQIEAGLRERTSTVLAAQHLVTNHLYDVDGDRAAGTSSFVMFRWQRPAPAEAGDRAGTAPGSGPAVLAHGGTYHDRLERTPDGWRFSLRRIEILWGPGTLAAGSRAR